MPVASMLVGGALTSCVAIIVGATVQLRHSDLTLVITALLHAATGTKSCLDCLLTFNLLIVLVINVAGILRINC
jgi:hypothetical protein